VRKEITVRQLPNFINGKFVETGNTFDVLYPITGEVTAQAHTAGKAEVDAAVAAARAALSGPWGKMPQAERATMVRAIADGINKRFDDFLEAEVLDTGKPYSVASHVDIPRGGANFATFADVLREHPTEAFRMDTPDGLGALNYGVRRPRGVIGIISPWNRPLLRPVMSGSLSVNGKRSNNSNSGSFGDLETWHSETTMRSIASKIAVRVASLYVLTLS